MQKIVILKNYDPVIIVLENSDNLHGDPQKDLIFENAIFLFLYCRADAIRTKRKQAIARLFCIVLSCIAFRKICCCFRKPR